MRASVLVWGVLAILVTTISVLPAWSHASMLKSTPADGAALTQSPGEIRAWFSEELARNSVMRLYDGTNAVIAVGGLDLKVQKHDQMRIVPPYLRPGSYEVRWRAVSADDNDVKTSSFRFTVQGAE